MPKNKLNMSNSQHNGDCEKKQLLDQAQTIQSAVIYAKTAHLDLNINFFGVNSVF